ncbi:MAG: ABC transporter permease [Christensenellales bacterium]
MILQSVKMALEAIASNKVRSFLTMLGIIIGVIALVVLVSLVSSATTTITDEVASLGTNLLYVSVWDDKGNPLKLEDMSAIAEHTEIAAVAPMGQFSATAKNGYTDKTCTVYGTTPELSVIRGLKVEYGRFLRTVDVENSSYVAVLSHDAATDLFGKTDAAGEKVSINGRSFLVAGVLEEDNNMTAMLGNSVAAYVPYTVAMRMSPSIYNVTTFYASSSNPNTMDYAEEALRAMMLRRFKQDEDAFMLFNQSAVMDAMGTITDILSYLLGGIAAISLLVGGIGIMNIMLVSVTERTKEIGIRKAIGASRSSIMMQFLIEALVISLVGCVIGILASWFLIQIATLLADGVIVFNLSPGVVAVAVIFSSAIGLLFGLYPANKAAKKHPIEALRYEG